MTTIPHAKAAKPGPWCNTAPTLRQRAKRRRHSLGGADELLAPRSLTDERTRPAEVVSKDATPTAARGEDAGVPTSDLTGSSPPEPSTVKYDEAPRKKAPKWLYASKRFAWTERDEFGRMTRHEPVNPVRLAIARADSMVAWPSETTSPPASTPFGRELRKVMERAVMEKVRREAAKNKPTNE